jgi:hypothetical protein
MVKFDDKGFSPERLQNLGWVEPFFRKHKTHHPWGNS